MGEVEDAVDVVFVEEDEREEDERLRQELAEDGDDDVVVGLGEPLLTTSELQLHAQRVG